MIDHDRIPTAPDTRTWAHVTTFESQSYEDVETALRVVVDQVIPLARSRPGWKGALALATEDRHRGLVITLWDSVENMVGSGHAMREELKGAGAGARLAVVAGMARFEIVLEDLPGGTSG